MASGSAESKMVEISVQKGENEYSLTISQELWDLIKDPNCDQELKNSIVESAISSSKPSMPCTSTSNSRPPSTSTNSPVEKVHIWQENEERALITTRADMEDEFNDMKNHDVLWGQIMKKLDSLGINVSVAQVKNKWKNLKKTYKKVVDENSHTGNKKVNWKFYEEFNKIYGNRASTRAEVAYDSSSIKRQMVNNSGTQDTGESDKSSDEPKLKKSKVERKQPKVATAAEAIEKLNKQGEDMKNQMQKQHKEKMERFDKLLRLFESSMTKK